MRRDISLLIFTGFLVTNVWGMPSAASPLSSLHNVATVSKSADAVGAHPGNPVDGPAPSADAIALQPDAHGVTDVGANSASPEGTPAMAEASYKQFWG